ncbi:MAG: glycoside hydrolase family 38 C-terminal domain-containing protein, partial [Christensenellaceae bacterium]
MKRYLDKKPGLPRFVFSKACDFFDEVLSLKKDFPVYKGEQNFIFEGCYTTKSKIKKLLRDGDARLCDADYAMAYKRMKTKADISQNVKKSMQAWKNICFNGFHDISCGCNIKNADAHDFKIGEQAIQSANEIVADCFDGKQTGVISVFNQLGFERTDVACVDEPIGIKKQGLVQDEMGGHTPYQILDGKMYFIAHKMPAFSVKKYYIAGDFDNEDVMEYSAACGIEDGSTYRIDSLRYLLEISAKTGTIVTLYDKKNRQDILERVKGITEVPSAFCAQKSSNVLKMSYEQPHIMSAWVMGNEYMQNYLIEPPKISLDACGAVFTKLKIERTYRNSTIIQSIKLFNEFDRIDFSIDIDWHEYGSYQTGIPTLRIGLTSDIKNPEFTYEIPMGSMKRMIQNAELPAYRYVALSD